MKKSNGFLLLEVIVALVLASFLSIMFMTSFWQLRRSSEKARTIMEASDRCIVIAQQMTRDVSGACIPPGAFAQHVKKFSQKGGAQTAAPPAKTKEGEGGVAAAKRVEPSYSIVFYASEKKEMLDVLSFITNNPRMTYWDERIGVPTPRIARVVYQLRAESAPGGVTSFALYRFEDASLAFSPEELAKRDSVRGIRVAGNIKSMRALFFMTSEEGDTSSVSTWNTDRKQMKGKEVVPPTLPVAVLISIALWDPQFRDATRRQLFIPILPSGDFSWINVKSTPGAATVAPQEPVTPPVAEKKGEGDAKE